MKVLVYLKCHQFKFDVVNKSNNQLNKYIYYPHSLLMSVCLRTWQTGFRYRIFAILGCGWIWQHEKSQHQGSSCNPFVLFQRALSKCMAHLISTLELLFQWSIMTTLLTLFTDISSLLCFKISLLDFVSYKVSVSLHQPRQLSSFLATILGSLFCFTSPNDHAYSSSGFSSSVWSKHLPWPSGHPRSVKRTGNQERVICWSQGSEAT